MTDCDAAAIASVLGALASHWRIQSVRLTDGAATAVCNNACQIQPATQR